MRMKTEKAKRYNERKKCWKKNVNENLKSAKRKTKEKGKKE